MCANYLLRNVAVCAFLMMAMSAHAARWEIVSQTRYVEARAEANLDDQMTEQQERHDATSFGPFDRSADAYAELLSELSETVSASASASLDSALLPTRMVASGSAGAGATSEAPPSSLGVAVAHAHTSVQFEMQGYGTLIVSGVLSSDNFGQSHLSLSGPAGQMQFEHHVQDAVATLEVDESVELTPGAYNLLIESFADATAFPLSGDNQYAAHDVQMFLVDCDPDGPGGTTFENVAFGALEGDPADVIRNIDLVDGGFWQPVGGGGSLPRVLDFAVQPGSGALYALIDDGARFIAVVDPDTAAVVSSVPLTVPPTSFDGVWGIAFHGDGTLWALYDLLQTQGEMGTVNLSTGAITPGGITSADLPARAVLARQPGTEFLFAAWDRQVVLVEVNSPLIVPLTINNSPLWRAMAFHPTGRPWVGADETGQLYEIDFDMFAAMPMTGAENPPGPLSALAFLPSVEISDVPCAPLYGDRDQDGDVDIDDYADFPPCLLGPSGGLPFGHCLIFDFDQDGDVDLGDYGSFQG